ncbi:hybrid sensor histidine kinase/response regulator [Maribellus luteus]|uniref:histidine kinase n=1 Tax=Maribellus luteus TaxID=2305463 RepID=A0A399SZA1_9BACT|nr:response regulator [Maribellus luteus]RIJ47952.1 hybrid sensor histidine kinase/response regulator [Maribellus luteus]
MKDANKPQILIVDDLPENLISLESILEDFDIRIVRATSGIEALKLTLKEEFALVILDVQMPEMNGYETLELMRQRKKTRYLPVIFVSAIHQSDLHIIKGIETGAVDFIPKPVIPDILRGKVKIFLDLYNQRVRLDRLLRDMEEANLNLKAAKDKAEEATRVKSMFLANMSHEIRTPLNGVIGISRLLQKSELNAEQQDLINIIAKSGENLMLIINDILDFSKIESGQVQFESISFQLRDMVKNIYQLLRFKAEEKGLNFSYTIDENVPSVLCGDPLRINQILMNLVNNAIKFTPQGKVEIRIELVDEYEQSSRILFRVIDTGIGISEEGKQVLFKEFQQTESSMSRRYGGTGLGLAISKNLVNLMNGEINVISTEGKGTEFYFRLPLKKSTLEEREKELQYQLPEDIRILVAEDNLINQKVFKLSLKQLGYNSDIAQNGQEAFDMHIANPYDIVFMDMQMPGTDGLQATSMIRAYERENADFPRTYIAAVTANSLNKDKDNCLSAGMNNFLSKPFSEKELITVLQEGFKVKANGFSLKYE